MPKRQGAILWGRASNKPLYYIAGDACEEVGNLIRLYHHEYVSLCLSRKRSITCPLLKCIYVCSSKRVCAPLCQKRREIVLTEKNDRLFINDKKVGLWIIDCSDLKVSTLKSSFFSKQQKTAF